MTIKTSNLGASLLQTGKGLLGVARHSWPLAAVATPALMINHQRRKELDSDTPQDQKYFTNLYKGTGKWLNKNRGTIGANVGGAAGLILAALATRNMPLLRRGLMLGGGAIGGAAVGTLAGRGMGSDGPSTSGGYNVNLIDPENYYVPRKNVYGLNSYSKLTKTKAELDAERKRDAKRYQRKTSQEKVANPLRGLMGLVKSAPKALGSGISNFAANNPKTTALATTGLGTLGLLQLQNQGWFDAKKPKKKIRSPYDRPESSFPIKLSFVKEAISSAVKNSRPLYGLIRQAKNLRIPPKPVSSFGKYLRRAGTAGGVLGGTLGLLHLQNKGWFDGKKPDIDPDAWMHPADRFIQGDNSQWSYDTKKHGPLVTRFTPPAMQAMMDDHTRYIVSQINKRNQNEAYKLYRQQYIDWFRNGQQGPKPKLQSPEALISQSKLK